MSIVIRTVALAALATFSYEAIAQVDVQDDLTTFSEADTTGELWVKGGVFQLNFTQVSLTNWAGGGYNSMAGIAQVNAYANRKRGRKAWDNSLVLALGGVKQGEGDWVKSDDRIELNSKYGYQLKEGGNLYLAGLLQFRTQFTEGFNVEADSMGNFERISHFMAPAYITAGVGLDYKPNENFSLFFSPATARLITVLEQELADQGQFGVEPAQVTAQGDTLVGTGETTVFQFGGFLRGQYQKPQLIKNVDFLTRFDVFSNYLDNPGNLDITWETLWTLKVNTWLAASLSTLLIYDHDIDIDQGLDDNDQRKVGPATQFRQSLGVGLTFTF